MTEEKEDRKEYGQMKIRTWGEINEQGIHKQNIMDRIDSMTLIKSFVVKEVDLLTIKRLVQYCRYNSKNDWGVGLKMLLDNAEADAKAMLLYEKITNLERKFTELESKFISKPEEKKETKTFGGV